jgi:hypothetical protein
MVPENPVSGFTHSPRARPRRETATGLSWKALGPDFLFISLRGAAAAIGVFRGDAARGQCLRRVWEGRGLTGDAKELRGA